jgi:DNA repair protein RadC
MKIPRQALRLVRDGASVDGPRRILCPADALLTMRALVPEDLPHEEVHLLALDGQNRPVGAFCVARGGVGGAGLLPADVFRPLVACNARAFIMAHNHPSGDPSPSRDDFAMTQALMQAGAVLGVQLLDHLVLGEGLSYRSAMPC